MSLYTVNKDIEELVALLSDAMEQRVSAPSAEADQRELNIKGRLFDKLSEQRELLTDLVKLRRNKTAQIDAIADEIARLHDKQEALTAQIQAMDDTILAAIGPEGKVKTDIGTLSFREGVNTIVDPKAALPEWAVRRKEIVTPDKVALKKHWQDTGEKPDGVTFETRYHASIK